MSKIIQTVADAFIDIMTTRVKLALLDAGNGIPHEEIRRRAEVDIDDPDEILAYKTAFSRLMNEGEISRTSCGFKRAENPWKTGGKVR